MATLQNTTVPDGGYYRVGTTTNSAFVSSGGAYAHFGQNAARLGKGVLVRGVS